MREPLAAALLLGALLAGCGDDTPARAPEILYGEDICDRCRMVISEERHAAAARFTGAEYRFDDPGCLRALVDEQDAGSAGSAWVHDEALLWRPVEETWFVVDPEGRTPMASGIVAFGSAAAAATAARRLGTRPRRWPELLGADAAGD